MGPFYLRSCLFSLKEILIWLIGCLIKCIVCIITELLLLDWRNVLTLHASTIPKIKPPSLMSRTFKIAHVRMIFANFVVSQIGTKLLSYSSVVKNIFHSLLILRVQSFPELRLKCYVNISKLCKAYVCIWISKLFLSFSTIFFITKIWKLYR